MQANISTAIELSVAEVAGLMGCSRQNVFKIVKNGKLTATQRTNAKGRPCYFIPLSALDLPIRKKYYKQNGIEFEAESKLASKEEPKETAQKPLDSYSESERWQIAFWTQVVQEWQEQRFSMGLPLEEADEHFVGYAFTRYRQGFEEHMERPLQLTRSILYRRQAALAIEDYDGLIECRGSHSRGNSSIEQKVWDAFLYYFLDETKSPITRCYEYTQLWAKAAFPELLETMPSISSFRRRISNDLTRAQITLGRDGHKAFDDRWAPYIRRTLEGMLPNDYWVGDTHTLDIISVDDKSEKTHRLYITAYMDVRSGIFVGIHISDTNSSQTSIIALRKAIEKYGIPKNLIVDNGHEYLTFDFGGLGHRRRKKHKNEFQPPPILQRMGIRMVNSLPKNAKAKIIERRFRDLKDHVSRLFDTFTGGNVVERPEQLKYKLKEGKVILDSDLKQNLEKIVFGYLNEQAFGSDVPADKGKSRNRVYHERLVQKREASEDDLRLFFMRSSRKQTVGQRGVHLDIEGRRYDYWNQEFLQAYQGEQVYYRYDPEDVSFIRVYDLQDKFLMSVPVDDAAVLEYGAGKDEISTAMKSVGRVRKAQITAVDELRKAIQNPIAKSELVLMQAENNLKIEYFPNASLEIEMAMADEEPAAMAVGEVRRCNISDKALESAEAYNKQYFGGGEDE